MTRTKSFPQKDAGRKRNRSIRKFVNYLLGLQEVSIIGEPERNVKQIKIISIITVPDLLFNGYRHPEFSSQYIVTLSNAIPQEEFRKKVRVAFGFERQT